MKQSCVSKVFDLQFDSAWRPQQEPSSWRRKVGLGAFTVPGYQCGDKDGTTLIFYPEQVGQETFNVVIYAHGLGGYLDAGPIDSQRGTINGVDSWLQDVASRGLIVLAPFTGPESTPGDCKTKHVDMLHALTYGNVDARVFTTGTLDFQRRNDTAMEQAFEQCASKTKVFVDLEGGLHMEPTEGKRLNFVTAQFLSCHVSEQQEHCDYIYGSDGLCARQDLHQCRTVRPEVLV